jgi:hypothetical protein
MDSLATPGGAYKNLPVVYFRPGAAGFLSIHSYLPFAAFYFFLNHAGLPSGLFYSTIFSPVLFLWLYLKGYRSLTAKLILFLSPFILAHLVMGVESPVYYLRSIALLWTAYITAYALCVALLRGRNIDRLLDELILLNFGASIIALAIRPTPLQSLLWMDTGETIAGTPHLLRLNLFTHEPSAYAELMLPLLVFSILRLLRNSSVKNTLYFMMIALPFLLSQSFGGISICLAGVGVAVMAGHRRLLRRSKSLLVFISLAVGVCAMLLIPNPISQRVLQVVTGGDSSAQSRTTLSFVVAYTVASSKSLLWGVGFGQGKVIDVSDAGIGFTVGIIPNAIAGIFAELGVIGVLAVFAGELYLFFRTKVYRNSFRLAMFIVAFATQLTGSYSVDVQEYLMWCFAFLPFFPDLNLLDDTPREIRNPRSRGVRD